MNILINKINRAIDLVFANNKMTLFVEDGREVSFPLEWFPKLSIATDSQLNKWRFIGNGEGIHWEELDEDLSVEKLLE
ncbi:MAG: DUF2442 domain-containing protein [Bacteroidota bacterium]